MGHAKQEHQSDKHAEHKVGKMNEANEAQSSNESSETKSRQAASIPRRVRMLRSVSGDAWGDLKTGVGNAYDEIRRSVKKVVSRYEQAMKEPGARA